jgi:hypothetical protein
VSISFFFSRAWILQPLPEFEYEAGGEFGALISVYQIPEHF